MVKILCSDGELDLALEEALLFGPNWIEHISTRKSKDYLQGRVDQLNCNPTQPKPCVGLPPAMPSAMRPIQMPLQRLAELKRPAPLDQHHPPLKKARTAPVPLGETPQFVRVQALADFADKQWDGTGDFRNRQALRNLVSTHKTSMQVCAHIKAST